MPSSVDELSSVVKNAKGPVRVAGAGHSFSAVVPTNDTLLSLELLSGIVSHDAANLTATIQAGTRLYLLGEPLAKLGQGLMVQPDIDLQSLGGVLATGSHGAGAQHRCMSSYIQALTLVTADGSVRKVSPQVEPEVFQAAQISLGSLGVLAEVTLQNRSAYLLEERTGISPLNDALDQFASWQKVDRHTEFFAFPRGDTAFTKRMREVPMTTAKTIANAQEEESELEYASEVGMRAPFTIPLIQSMASWFVPDVTNVGASYHIFPTVRHTRFNEMEYAVPAEKGPACFREVAAKIREDGLPVFFPLEYRHVGADDLWLSPHHGRESVTISVHQYFKQDHVALFKAVEPIFWKYDGRPHWGKWHSLTAKELAGRYDRWQDFLRVRKDVDPTGKFLNPHLHQLFGV
jgi:FAD-linked oxidoreductase